ncbi:MAG: electron transfer flavoprotein subunit beta/FixA family protein [Thermoplasmata archaeon]|nr:MAG: electron transfer flavoprotein subunit beta/FixA family protein [Thermoplasmata archaeon]
MVESVVCLKQVFDVSKITIDTDTNKPILTGVPRKISDFDKNALEEAVKLKEAHGGSVKTVTIGETEKLTENLREALAIGSDISYALEDKLFENLDSFGTASVLAGAIKKLEKYDLVICGEASIDNYAGQVGVQLAEILGVPVATYVKKVTQDGNKIKVERALGLVTEEVELELPAVVTVTKEINEPRLPNLMQIMGASSKPIETWSASDIGLGEGELGADAHKMTTVDVKGVTMERKRQVYQDDDVDKGIEEIAGVLLKGGFVGGA